MTLIDKSIEDGSAPDVRQLQPAALTAIWRYVAGQLGGRLEGTEERQPLLVHSFDRTHMTGGSYRELVRFYVLTERNRDEVFDHLALQKDFSKIRIGKEYINIGRGDIISYIIFSVEYSNLGDFIHDSELNLVGMGLKFFGPDAIEELIDRYAYLKNKYLWSAAMTIAALRQELESEKKMNASLQSEVGAYKKFTAEIGDLRHRADTNAAWRSLFAMLAHNVTSTVTAIIRISTKNGGARAGEGDNPFAKIRASALRIQARVSGLEARYLKKQLEIQVIPLRGLVDRLRALASENDITVEARFSRSRGNYMIEADVERISDVVQEMIANAHYWLAQRSPPGAGRDLIRLDMDVIDEMLAGSMLEIVVSDNGPGVLDQDKQAIFLPTVTYRPNGTGAGLAEVMYVCEKHGGYAFENGRFGKGARFVLRLPLKGNAS